MDFTLNDEQRMFAETAQTLFADTCTPDHWRKQMETGEARDDARWQAIVETGFTLLLLPEEAGGLGLTELDFALIAEKAGYVVLPEPLAESAGVAAPLLAALAPDSDVLADPSATIAIKHPANLYVLDADLAGAIILHKDGEAWLATPDQVTLTREDSIDPFRRLFRVEWDAANATKLGKADWDLALDRGALFCAAQGLGLAQRSVDLAVAYAQERQQFGKPIGSYQAIQHRLAECMVAVRAVQILARRAASLGTQEAALAALVHAKEICPRIIYDTHQFQGAIGLTYEYPLHFYTYRLRVLHGELSNLADSADLLAATRWDGGPIDWCD